ncbi:metallophosphoesterase [Bacillus sp. H-16]|uniref:metallophosphoesterase n=1 Tax=Alteribacter salitolerans TaxID=2912333 RepID=UPI0019646657|nr:metallophosphoesterase [Alteribacter salitolerans]MBM7095431.1 metallophosphoesterase [Alteribacter salitolerans]
MNGKAILNFGIFLLIYNVLTFYIGWNGWIWLNTAFGFEHVWLYTAATALLAYAYLIGRVNLTFFKVVGAYWVGLFQYGLLLFPFANLVVIALLIGGVDEDAAVLYTGLVTLTALAGIFLTGTFNAYSPVKQTYSVSLPKRTGSLTSLKIGMASDMHFGTLSGKTHLRRLINELNKMEADVIVLPGDIIDDSPDVFQKKNMGPLMKELKATYGVYGILGNHEYYGRKVTEILNELGRSGVTMLTDEVTEVAGSFYLIGRRDRTEKNRKPVEELIGGLDLSKPVILLDHQPFELERAEKAGADLMLSGHTHRGQMYPNNWITRRMYEVDWGYLKKDTLHTIVSSGFGFWGPPLRLGSRSEVVEIVVTFKD